jgi:hypothetical protein
MAWKLTLSTDEPIDLELPTSVIQDRRGEFAVRGDTARANKMVTTETGLRVQVPCS